MSKVFIATAQNWNKEGQEFDKNGVQNIVLVPLAGTAPRNLNIVAGTVAENSGLKDGKAYLMNAVEGEPYTNEATGQTSRSFNFNKVAELTAMEIFEMMQSGTAKDLKVLIAPVATEAVAEKADLGVDA